MSLTGRPIPPPPSNNKPFEKDNERDKEDDRGQGIKDPVNTVVVENGTLRGLNTDGSGFIEACREAGFSLSGRRVLIVGAGGAAAAIAAASLNEGASRLHVVNRSAKRAEELCKKLSRAARGTEVLVHPLDEVDEAAEEAEILINATYLGMKEGDPLPIPAGAITADKVVCDAVYLAGRETTLIRCARADGARTVPGGRMLVYQGVQAQRVWTGREPNVEAMSDALARRNGPSL